MNKPYVGRKIKYPDFVALDGILSNETEGFRHSLYIPFNTIIKNEAVVVIMKNPSSASSLFCDNTISKVCNVAYNHGYSGVIILNLFPIKATNASQVAMLYGSRNYSSIMARNLQLIQATCQDRDVIFAWGKNSIGKNRSYPNYYNQAIINVTSTVVNRTYYVDKCHCKKPQCNKQHPTLRFPLHGLRWKNSSKMIKY